MYRLLAFLFFAPLGLLAQLNVDKTEFDFGQIAVFNNDTAFFTFTNSGAKTIYLLPTQPREDYEILCNTKTIGPGETMSLAIVYYTDQKGKFNLLVPLYFSHSGKPIQLSIKGNIKSIAETAFNRCPSIENSRPLQASQVPLSIVVRDAQTLEFLEADQVKVTQNRKIFNCVSGYNSKTYKCNCGYGPLYAEVSKKGYKAQAQEFTYDPEHFKIIVDLEKMPEDTAEIKPNKPEKPVDPIVYTRDTSEPDLGYIPSSVYDSGFNSSRYRPNHLIFIIDVSGSMKDSTKLYYLKKAMTRLILSARPQDHITLITYAYKVKVIFENYSGTDRTAMMKAIDTLSASGGSNGASSLMMAYELASRYFIKGGNNQIFLATDGLLNSSKISEEDLYKLARKNFHSDGIVLSSIGFGHDEKALQFLQKLARQGHGNFLRINNTSSDIEVLIEEVKLQSLSKP